MHERIKKVRKALDLTQQEFADRLCIKRNTVATYETGKSNPSDAAVVLICKTFSINEDWLRTGEGEMFIPSPTSELDALAARYPQMTHETYVFIEKLVNLPEATQNIIMGFLREVVSGFGDVEPGMKALPGQISPAVSNMTSEDLHAELDRQIAEEKKQADGQSASGRGSFGRGIG